MFASRHPHKAPVACLKTLSAALICATALATAFSALPCIPAPAYAADPAAVPQATAADEWHGLLLNPDEGVMTEILESCDAVTSSAQAAGVAKQIANCEQLSHTVILVNPFELNPYVGSVAYTIDITALSNGIIPADSEVIVRYLCAGDNGKSSAGRTFTSDEIGKVTRTHDVVSVSESGSVTIELHGGGVYALGYAETVDAIEIDMSKTAEEVPTVPAAPDVPTNVIATTSPAGTGGFAAGSGSGITFSNASGVGWSGAGAATDAAGAGAGAGAGGLKVSQGAGSVSSGTGFLDEEGDGVPFGSEGDVAASEDGPDDRSMFERLFMQGGRISPMKVALAVAVWLAVICAVALTLYCFIRRRKTDRAVIAAQRALAAQSREEGSGSVDEVKGAHVREESGRP